MISSLLHKDCEALYDDSGRNWKGKKEGVDRLLTQVRMLKKQEGASVKLKVFFGGDGVYKVDEILLYNGKEAVTKVVFTLKGDEICKIDYTKAE